jgi:hypothetical protein
MNAGRNNAVILAAMLCLFFSACKKPTDGLTLSIAPQLFDYTVAVQFYNAADPAHPPANISLKIDGKDASGIYEISGNKKLTVVDGFISLGLLSDRNPVQGNPIQFTMQVSAPGYLPLTIPVTIQQDRKVQFLQVAMVNLTTPPAGVSLKKTSIDLNNNTVSSAVSISTPLSQGKQEGVTLIIPAGTQCKDDAGNTMGGNTLAVTLFHFDARTAASLNAYPGGQRSSSLVKDTTGNTAAHYFQTAGWVYMQCSLDGKPVASFSQGATAIMDVSGQQWNPKAGRNFGSGDLLPLYRFIQGTAAWNATGSTVLTNTGGKLKAQFSMSWATAYSLAFTGIVCAEPRIVFNTGTTDPEVFRVDIFAPNDEFTPVYSQLVQVKDQEAIPFFNLPAGNLTLKVYSYGTDNPLHDFFVHNQAIGVFNGNACSGNGSVTLDKQNKEPLYFDIQGYCSNTKTYVRPTFYVLYALPGSGDFQPLGLVQNGRFSTRNLDVNKLYDFKVIWGGNRSSLVTGKLADTPGDKVTIIIPKTEEASFCP